MSFYISASLTLFEPGFISTTPKTSGTTKTSRLSHGEEQDSLHLSKDVCIFLFVSLTWFGPGFISTPPMTSSTARASSMNQGEEQESLYILHYVSLFLPLILTWFWPGFISTTPMTSSRKRSTNLKTRARNKIPCTYCMSLYISASITPKTSSTTRTSSLSQGEEQDSLQLL